MMVRIAFLAALLGGSLALPSEAEACGTCAVGDPTLTIMGTAQPTENRVRLALTFRHRTDELGEPRVNLVELSEQRIETSLAWSPKDYLTLSLMAPVVHRRLTQVNGAVDEFWSIGDLDLRLRGVLFRDRERAPRHLFSGLIGLELPTAPVDEQDNGDPLPLELQAGTGSWDPILGLTYGFFSDPWSFTAVSSVVVGTEGRADAKVGTSWRTTARVQLQPWPEAGFQLGTDFRYDQRNIESGQVDPDSGGFIAYLTAGLVGTPAMGLMLYASFSYPVANALYGFHDEGPALTLGALYDF